MIDIHSSQLLFAPPQPIEYLVDELLPLGAGGDVSGPPGEGKSTILLSLAAKISTGAPWFGQKTTQTPCAWISGEASSPAALARDLHRLKVSEDVDILFMLPTSEMFRFIGDTWTTTSEGEAVLARIRAAQIGFVVLDTIGSLCAGLKEIDNDQQRQLARHLRACLTGLTWITISHTNQASAKDALPWRLHYLSRAGGNGFPGAVRWAAGVSAVVEEDYTLPKCALPAWPTAGNPRFVAFGVSKHNEMPAPVWTNRAPSIFEIRGDGSLVLVLDGREGRGRAMPQRKEAKNERPAVCTL